jgi:tRNA pseudouridine55 synthase
VADSNRISRASVTVHALELVGLEPLRLRIVCTAGTYVRALARDLGEALGCGGAVEALRRTRVGPFRVEEASDQVYPVEQAVGFLPPVLLSEEERRALVDGKPVPAEGTGLVRVSGPAGFVGVGRLVEGRLQAERVLYNR